MANLSLPLKITEIGVICYNAHGKLYHSLQIQGVNDLYKFSWLGVANLKVSMEFINSFLMICARLIITPFLLTISEEAFP